MVFFPLPTPKKCKEQQMRLFVTFTDLTMAFDLGETAFSISYQKPPKLKSLIKSLYNSPTGTVQCNGGFSEPISILSGVK